MPPELLSLQALLTPDERSRCLSQKLVTGAYLLSIVILFIAGVFLIPSGTPAWYAITGAVVLGLFAVRASFHRDSYYAELFEKATERLQDEVFLRYRLIPTRQVRLGHVADFVDLEDEPVRGVVTLSREGTPQFLQAYAVAD